MKLERRKERIPRSQRSKAKKLEGAKVRGCSYYRKVLALNRPGRDFPCADPVVAL